MPQVERVSGGPSEGSLVYIIVIGGAGTIGAAVAGRQSGDVHVDICFNPGRPPVPMREIASAFLRSIEGWRTGEVVRAW